MFKYNFKQMVEWYDEEIDNPDLFINDENMVAFFITRSLKYESVKKHKKGKQSNFVKTFINIDKIRRIKFINNVAFYPNGLYYVKQNESNVFFVFPRLKTNMVGESIQLADHYSFPFVKSKDCVDIHLTTYTPFESDIHQGTINHLPRCPIHNNVSLPIQNYDSEVFNAMGGLNRDVLDLCRAYKTFKVEHTGGSKYKRVAQVKETTVSEQLELLLLQLKIKQVNAFGYYENDVWNIMVDLVRSPRSQLENEIAFTLKKPSLGLFEKKLLEALK